MHLCAFVAIFVPKLVAMVTPICPLCTKVSQINSPIDNPNLKTKLCMDMLHTTEVMAILLTFLPIYFGQNLVAMATSLDPCNQKCHLWIGLPQKPPVISNRILVISHTNAFICIYSYFNPKIGCHSNAPLSLVYGSVTVEFPDSANPVSKPNSARICCTQLKPWQRPFDPCNQKCRLWIGRPRKPPVISNCILVISRRNAFMCIYSNFCLKITCHGDVPLSLVYWNVTDEFPDRQTQSQNETLHGYVAYN